MLALVFVAIDAAGDVANELEREPVVVGNFLGRLQIFDIGLQDAIQDVVRRQGILILLIGPQLG